jgi:RNA 2',3'-cyclic 3'-phosphodiesterase
MARRMRTFIAVAIDKRTRDRVADLQETLAESGAGVKWVEEKNLHLTLLFLGEVDERTVPEVCRAVAAVTAEREPFEMSIRSVGGFPNAQQPKILWVGVDEGKEELIALHDDLELPLLELGCYRREARKYTPHLTLGRVKRDEDAEALAAPLLRQGGWEGGRTGVNEVLVMSSELRYEGPEYTVMSRAKFG